MGSQHWMDIFFNKNGVAVSNPVEVMLYLQQDTSMLKIWYKWNAEIRCRNTIQWNQTITKEGSALWKN